MAKWVQFVAISGLVFSATGAMVQSAGRDDKATVARGTALDAQPGPASQFTGTVTIRSVTKPEAPGRTRVGLVSFNAGARTNWHTHPAGQSLYVTQGCGWLQVENKPAQRFCKGDGAYIRAGERHWHGATATTAMSHLAITEAVDGKNVDWAEPVTASQYRGPAR